MEQPSRTKVKEGWNSKNAESEYACFNVRHFSVSDAQARMGALQTFLLVKF